MEEAMKSIILAISAIISLSFAISATAQTGKEQEPSGSGTTLQPTAEETPSSNTDESKAKQKSSETGPNPGGSAGKYENEMDEVKERMQKARERRAGNQTNEKEKEATASPGAKGTPPGNHYGWEKGNNNPHQSASPGPSANASAAVSASPSASAVASPSASIGLTPTPSPR